MKPSITEEIIRFESQAKNRTYVESRLLRRTKGSWRKATTWSYLWRSSARLRADGTGSFEAVFPEVADDHAGQD